MKRGSAHAPDHLKIWLPAKRCHIPTPQLVRLRCVSTHSGQPKRMPGHWSSREVAVKLATRSMCGSSVDGVERDCVLNGHGKSTSDVRTGSWGIGDYHNRDAFHESFAAHRSTLRIRLSGCVRRRMPATSRASLQQRCFQKDSHYTNTFRVKFVFCRWDATFHHNVCVGEL